MNKMFRFTLGLFSIVLLLSACSKSVEKSATTGWNYNDPEWGGFQKTGLRRPDHRSQSCSYWRRYLQHGSYRAGCYFRVEQRSPKGYRFFFLYGWNRGCQYRLPRIPSLVEKNLCFLSWCVERSTSWYPWYGGKNLPSTNHSWRHTSDTHLTILTRW